MLLGMPKERVTAFMKPQSSLTKDAFKAHDAGSQRETAKTVSHTSLKPDSLSIPQELQRNSWSSLTDNELSKAHKTDFHRKSPSELSIETAMTASHTSWKSPTCVEN